MKTKEFIKMLQEADPKGEGYLRFPNGFPVFADTKDGYWDGAYSYLDKNGNYITSTRGYKVDIYCMGLEEFIEREFDLFDPNNWEKIQSKLIFDYEGYSPDVSERKKNNVLKTAKVLWYELYDLEYKYFKEYEKKSVELAKQGYRFYQSKKVDTEPNYTYYHWIFYHGWKKVKTNTSIADTQGICKSDKFKRVDSNIKGYYEWVLKNE